MALRRPHHFGAVSKGLLAALLPIALVAVARADDTRPPALRNVTIEQRLNEQVPLDLTFRDETGQPVRLGQYFGDKPVIL
ncbi:MAG TPA: SCO family protein, partial [Candidatus Kryptonia bacterium]|nr:SCO family protein [Candidatus Kryptonia bacterium]